MGEPLEQKQSFPVIAIFGPTASGKSAVAEAIAERVSGELVSADAMQVYRGLPILTNQSQARLVAIWPLDHEASLGEYARLAHAEIDEILSRKKTPIVVGGTGLYFRAALCELGLPPAPKPEARERWQIAYDELGPEGAHALLADRDPETASVVHANDRRRVVRALELSDLGHTLRPTVDRLWSEDFRHASIVFGLELRPAELEKRIKARTRSMFERDVAGEVAQALARPVSTTASKVIGLREIAGLEREQAIAVVIKRTRRYAAYQRKWMRRLPGLVSVRADRPIGEIADEIVEVARTRKRLPSARAD